MIEGNATHWPHRHRRRLAIPDSDEASKLSRKTGVIDLGSDGESSVAPDDTPLNESEADPSTPDPTSVWNRDEVVVSIELKEDDSGGGTLEQYGRAETRNAVTEWNDYITENEAFDLTLTFDENPSNADVLFQMISGEGCSGEYDSPAYGDTAIDRQLCVETVTEEPSDDDLPLTASIAPLGGGKAAFRLVAKHGIGRFLGYDIWSEPTDIMTPKILFHPSHRYYGHETGTILSGISAADRGRTEAADNLLPMASDLRDAQNNGYAEDSLEHTRRNMTTWLDNRTENFDAFRQEAETLEIPHYREAIEDTIENREIAHLNETVTLIDDLLDSNEDIIGTDDYDTVIDRLEAIEDWPDREPFDVRIHRYYGETAWSQWANE